MALFFISLQREFVFHFKYNVLPSLLPRSAQSSAARPARLGQTRPHSRLAPVSRRIFEVTDDDEEEVLAPLFAGFVR